MQKTQLKSVKVGKLVNTQHVNAAITHYKKERWIQNSKRIGKEDSLSVWYSVEELEDFLQLVKEHGGDGIKMYFGAYSQTDAPQPLYADRQTIVLVATKTKSSLKGDVNKDLYVSNKDQTSILAYNSGRICPPFCTNDDGYDGGLGITILDKGNEGMIVV